MLRTTRLRKGADELKLEMRKACPFPLCDLLPSKGTSHAPFSIYSISLAECAEGHMTPISRVNCWGQDGHHLCWANLFPRDLLLRYLSVSMGCLSCHKIRSLGSNGWTTCKCSKERLFEERVRKQESERQGRTAASGRVWERGGALVTDGLMSCFHSQVRMSFPLFWFATFPHISFDLNLLGWELVLRKVATKSFLKQGWKKKSILRLDETKNKDMMVEKRTWWERT